MPPETAPSATTSTTGKDRVLALLPNAYMQGERAGVNMARRRRRITTRPLPMNAIGMFLGLHMITAGVL